jgi:hypothetical protein
MKQECSSLTMFIDAEWECVPKKVEVDRKKTYKIKQYKIF